MSVVEVAVTAINASHSCFGTVAAKRKCTTMLRQLLKGPSTSTSSYTKACRVPQRKPSCLGPQGVRSQLWLHDFQSTPQSTQASLKVPGTQVLHAKPRSCSHPDCKSTIQDVGIATLLETSSRTLYGRVSDKEHLFHKHGLVCYHVSEAQYIPVRNTDLFLKSI